MENAFFCRSLPVLMLAAGIAAVPPRAFAAGPGVRVAVLGTEQRECPDTRCRVRQRIPRGARTPVWCRRDGGAAFGARRWFRVRHQGVDGWVNAKRLRSLPAVPPCPDLRAGEVLFPGQSLRSRNSKYRLTMRKNGDLVLSGPRGVLWGNRNGKAPGNRAVVRENGDFAVLGPGGAALWETGTGAWGAASLTVEDGGDAVLRAGGRPLWAASHHSRVGRAQGANMGAAGNCTWYAFERFKAFTGHYPAIYGDAHAWDEQARASGWLVLAEPEPQSVVVWERSARRVYGHVGWVDATRPAPGGVEIHVVEMNAPYLGVVSDRWVAHEPGMSYVMAPNR